MPAPTTYRTPLALAGITVAALACARLAADGRPGVRFDAPHELSGATADVGAAPMVAVGPGGRRASPTRC